MRFLIVLGLAFGLVGTANAQPAGASSTVRIGGWYGALGYCQLTSISSATPLSSCTNGIPAGTGFIEVCVETANVRYRDDGTNPTASVGMPVASGTCFPYAAAIGAIAFIAQSGSPIVNVSFYK